MNEKEKRIKEIQEIGPTFCLAKWLQVTLDLEHGTNHSCHHPKRHEIPLEGLLENPMLLHNTEYKKRMRQYMIEGLRPRECSYCWDIEDHTPNRLSDRLIKSTDDWAYPFLKEVLASPQKDFAPRYLELMFSSQCQLSCIYCMSDISTKVNEEMSLFGPYPVRQKDHRDKEFKKATAPNIYLEAFWKWFPQIATELHYLRITGGEPFLDKNTFSLLEYIDKNPLAKLHLAINSNCSLEKEQLSSYFGLLKKLTVEGKIKTLELYVSLDTYGTQSEYIRYGQNYELVLKNIIFAKEEIPELKIIFMTTFNILSFENFSLFIQDLNELKKRFSDITLDICILKNPEYLRPELAPKVFFKELENISLADFSAHEKEKFFCLVDYLKSEKAEDQIRILKNDFLSFIKEYDSRKKTNFSKIFPKLSQGLRNEI